MKNLALIPNLLIAGTLVSCGQKNSSPNFIVIFSDDQSWVGTSFLASPDDPRTKSDFYQTPNMERLAQMGMQFTDGYSAAPFCCPSRKSLLTGLTPAKHEYQQDRENWTKEFRKNLTIPQALKKANPKYQTAHFGKWDARYDEVTPEEMGYDFSDGLTSNATGGSKGADWPAAVADPKLIFDLTERSCKFMEEQVTKGNPFYLQVSHYAVHLGMFYTQESIDKYNKLSPGEKHNIPEFAAMTVDLDTGIGILMDKIAELGLLENTYIIFLSDNGGRTSQPIGGEQKFPGNFPLRQGKGTMYEGGIRVPFVVIGPDVNPGSNSHVPVTSVDILPTLADLAGYKEVLPEKLDGGSIADIIRNQGIGEVVRNNPYLVFHQAVDRKPQSAIREGNFKLVKTWEENKLELFDLSNDVGEENDLAEKMPGKVKELNSKLEFYLSEANAETRKIQKGKSED
ncbi:MAG: sulfatase [Bacteroidales bacterium]|nr:sulfatase [Bacteroidales bacterium]MCF8392044.1 sulfatase [Bacteroidales bacterium]